MSKSYVIQRLSDGHYLKAMTGEVFTANIMEAGTWPSEKAAESWLNTIDKPGRYTIIPIWSEW